jgi:hypothetical protein
MASRWIARFLRERLARKEGGGAQEFGGKGKLIIGMTATSNDVVESLGLGLFKITTKGRAVASRTS